MVESTPDAFVMLGFIDKPPHNSLLTQAMLTPSKIGGKPAWIATKGLPSTDCQVCHQPLLFLGQVYANLDALDDFHRMLYVFACVSEKCIGTQCVRVFRALVHDKNPMVTFLSDNDYNQVCNKTDEELETTKWSKYLDEGEWGDDDGADEEVKSAESDREEVLLDEYLIETDEEQQKVTQMYLTHAARLRLDPKTKDEEDDELKEQLENAFISLQFGNLKKQNQENEKRAQKLLQNYRQKEENASSDEEDTAKMEEKALEDFIDTHHTNYAAIEDHYKLFEVITTENPS